MPRIAKWKWGSENLLTAQDTKMGIGLLKPADLDGFRAVSPIPTHGAR
jgi:hypothetical protein